MSEPADKSDDLINELARLMATPAAGAKPAVQPVAARPAPVPPVAPAQQAAPAAAAPTPIRIPGMDAMPPRPQPVQPANPAPQSAPVQSAPQPANPVQRQPATGTIRIPGMDQPAPVATTVPVGKFEFAGATPVRSEPVVSVAERIVRAEQAKVAATPQPAPVATSAPVARTPAPQAPAAENRPASSSAPASRPQVPAPAAPAAPPAGPPSDFHFDFGFSDNPPQATNVPQLRPTAQTVDPIAALIEADMASDPDVADIVDNGRADAAAVNVARLSPVQAAPRQAPVPVQVNSPRPATTPIPLKPVTAAPRNPAGDRFMVAPAAGIEVRASESAPQPRAQAPSVPSDPMAEIESLIGEAVRVELTPEPARAQTPQLVSPRVELEPEPMVEAEIRGKGEPPVVPPLTGNFAPRRARLKDEGRPTAEDAILAAVAAGGPGLDQVDQIEPSVAKEGPYQRVKMKPQRRGFLSGGMRQYIGMAVAGTLLLAAGLGLYWVLNMGRAATVSGANAPQLTADATPVKVKPVATDKPKTDAQNSPVLAKIDGASAAPSSEKLVQPDTTPSVVARDVTPTDADPDGGLANRKVRTVTVRPDGTIVSGDDAVAGAEALPVDRPNVPDVPSNATTTLLGADGTQPASVATTDTAPSLTDSTTAPVATASATDQISETPVIDPTAVAPKPLNFPVHVATTTPLAAPPTTLGATVTPKATAPKTTAPRNTAVNAVVGAQTPDGQIDLLGGDTGTQAPATTAVQAPPATSGGNAAAYVQLSSQPTQADAQASAKNVAAKFGSLFGGQKLVVQQADLGQKGVRWRVRLPASSLSQAQSICSQIKAQGGDCFATGG